MGTNQFHKLKDKLAFLDEDCVITCPKSSGGEVKWYLNHINQLKLLFVSDTFSKKLFIDLYIIKTAVTYIFVNLQRIFICFVFIDLFSGIRMNVFCPCLIKLLCQMMKRTQH